jgi:hypothetical protein
MGHADAATRSGQPTPVTVLTSLAVRMSDANVRRREHLDDLVLGALVLVLILTASARRDFLGDGIRHLSAALSSAPHFGEARWLLFPPLLFFLIRPLAALGLVNGREAAIQPFLWASVASGALFLFSLRVWLRAECKDSARRAAALLLAGSCAPFLTLFSDIAEPQIAAALAVAGLAHARVRRDDPVRAQHAALVAIGAIACAALIYQGIILALGMLPLVTSRDTLTRRRVLGALCAAVALVPAAIMAAQIAAGMPPALALATTVGGERNSLARPFMARPSPAKYVAALVAGPPQGIVALKNFSGLSALLTAVHSSDARAVALAAANVCRLVLGCVIVWTLFVAGVRNREWRVVAAAGILLILPVLRNQQYAYPKFFILWPVPLSLLALRYRGRLVGIAALIVLVSNGWLLAEDVRGGRQMYTNVRQAYQAATPATCWLTSGWAPPLLYLWPGTTTNILGTLATGRDPAIQARSLTQSLRRCFCESDSVWTDTTDRDSAIVASLARHFDYGAVDLTTVLLPSSSPDTVTFAPGVHLYPQPARERICRAVTAADVR